MVEMFDQGVVLECDKTLYYVLYLFHIELSHKYLNTYLVCLITHCR